MGFTYYEILREFQGGLDVWWFGGLGYSMKKSWASPHDFLWKLEGKEEVGGFI